MQKRQKDGLKQYAKVVLIICCIFAVISSFLLITIICTVPQLIKEGQKAKDLYENGIEVDAHIKRYYYNRGTSTRIGIITSHSARGYFYIIYEYVDDNNRTYRDEYRDTVGCKTVEERNAREQYIKQLIADGETMKMLISDNGTCRLSVYKESLIAHTSEIIYISIITVSSVVLGLCIFGIVKRSKELRRFGKNI